MKKVIGLGCGLVVLLIAGLVVAVALSAGSSMKMNDVAEAFLAASAAGDRTGAEALLSSRFEQVDKDGMDGFLRASTLNQYRSVSWSGFQVGTDGSSVSGDVTTARGVVPLTVHFEKEDGEWRILRLDMDEDFDVMSLWTPPSEADAVALVERTTQAFAEAAHAGELSAFHAAASRDFQEQVPEAVFLERFAPFGALDLDMRDRGGVLPVLTSGPVFREPRVLEVAGHYPTSPSRIDFTYGFVDNAGEWELLAIHLNVRPAE